MDNNPWQEIEIHDCQKMMLVSVRQKQKLHFQNIAML